MFEESLEEGGRWGGFSLGGTSVYTYTPPSRYHENKKIPPPDIMKTKRVLIHDSLAKHSH